MATAVLTIDINARLASLEQALTKVNSSVNASARAMQSSMGIMRGAADGVRSALIGIASAASVGVFVRLVRGAIDAADHLNDLSRSTGVTVEKLGGIGFAARQSGSNLDDAAAAFGKLNLRIAAAIAGNEDAARTFRVIGISIEELKQSSPDEIFAKLADRFSEYEDGANEAALGNALFGKSYQGILPLLNEGGDQLRKNISYFEQYGGVTTDVARQADAFNDQLEKLSLLSGGFGRTLAATVLPSLDALAKHLLAAKEQGGGLSTVGEGLGRIFNGLAGIVTPLIGLVLQLGNSFGAVAAASGAFFSGEGFMGRKGVSRAFSIMSQLKDDNAQIDRRYTELAKTILSGNSKLEAAGAAAGGKTKGKGSQAPSLGKGGAAGGGSAAEDPDRKLLDNKLRALERVIADEREVLQDRLGFLQDYYQSDLLGISDYFERRRQATSDALRATVAAFDEEENALRARDAALASRKTPGKGDEQERITLEGKIAEVIDKRAKAQRQAAIEGSKAWEQERQAGQAFLDKVEEIGIALAELDRDPNAARKRFDFANRGLRDKLEAETQSANESARRAAEIGLRDLAVTRDRVVVQSDLNRVTEQFGTIMDDVGRAQRRIDIAFRSGAIGEIESLRQTSELHASKVAILQREIDAAENLARAITNPAAQAAALANIDELRLRMEDLAATGDLVAKKFNDVFAGAFADALSDFATGTKSFKDAVKDMEQSIVRSISNIASQRIGEALFGKGGPASGIGDFFSSLFGGKGAASGVAGAAGAAGGAASAVTGAGGAAAADASLLALSTTAATTTAAFTAADAALLATTTTAAAVTAALSSMAASAASAAAALAAVAASSTASAASGAAGIFGSVLSGAAQGGGLAAGTDFWRGGVTMVGERGPEKVYLPRGSKVIPNDQLVARREARNVMVTNNTTINVPQGTSRASSTQIAADAARAIQVGARNL